MPSALVRDAPAESPVRGKSSKVRSSTPKRPGTVAACPRRARAAGPAAPDRFPARAAQPFLLRDDPVVEVRAAWSYAPARPPSTRG
ncbi:hypothetical protein GCM10015536_75710 [Streptomyces griseomycini]|nr:hypothetical protein GCM10015536_75710 [Streptomyces griseomycini]